MPDVFISHATADDEVVSELHDELEARTGVEMWVDHKDIKPGENWQNKIESALKTCPYLLMVVSRNAVKSDEVTAEWRAALTYNHALLLAIIDDVPHEDIPARLRLHQWVDLQTDREAGLAKLAAAITGEAADTDAPTFTRRATLLGGEAMDRRLTSIPIQGREAELVEVRSKLELRQPVMVLAYGGSGKSRLAAELALTDTRGALWHVCSESSQPYTVTDLLREHFGMEDTAAANEVLKRLRSHPRLIVLDNAEVIGKNDPRRAGYIELVNQLVHHGADVLLTSRTNWKDLKPHLIHSLGALTLEAAADVVREMAKLNEVALNGEAQALAEACRRHPRLIEYAMGLMVDFPRHKVLTDVQDLRGDTVEDALTDMIRKTALEMTNTHGDDPVMVLRRLNVMRGAFTYEAGWAVGTLGANLAFSSKKEENGMITHLNPQLAIDTRAFDRALGVLQTYRFIRFEAQRYTIDELVREALGEDNNAQEARFTYYEYLYGKGGSTGGY